EKGKDRMNTSPKIILALVTGISLGGAAVQGLHAQAKPKAYTVSELEPMNAAALAGLGGKVTETITAAGGRPLRTAGGRIVAMEGTAPKRVAITEFDSLEQAEAFYKSKGWNDLQHELNKVVKLVRRYTVEVRP